MRRPEHTTLFGKPYLWLPDNGKLSLRPALTTGQRRQPHVQFTADLVRAAMRRLRTH